MSFNCEKCNDDFHSLGGLKKHLRKVLDVRNLILKGNLKLVIKCERGSRTFEDSLMIFLLIMNPKCGQYGKATNAVEN